jgi:hypothetical protein
MKYRFAIFTGGDVGREDQAYPERYGNALSSEHPPL